jgi:hypothetical protein
VYTLTLSYCGTMYRLQWLWQRVPMDGQLEEQTKWLEGHLRFKRFQITHLTFHRLRKYTTVSMGRVSNVCGCVSNWSTLMLRVKTFHCDLLLLTIMQWGRLLRREWVVGSAGGLCVCWESTAACTLHADHTAHVACTSVAKCTHMLFNHCTHTAA